jgi:hypothetical protein
VGRLVPRCVRPVAAPFAPGVSASLSATGVEVPKCPQRLPGWVSKR